MDFQSDCLTSHVTQCFRFVSPPRELYNMFLLENINLDNNS